MRLEGDEQKASLQAGRGSTYLDRKRHLDGCKERMAGPITLCISGRPEHIPSHGKQTALRDISRSPLIRL